MPACVLLRAAKATSSPGPADEKLPNVFVSGIMQNNVWIDLFRRVPAEYQNNLMVVTSIGTEIAIQSIMRIEETLVILRGRVSGSQDTGRVFFLPYHQINYAGFQKPLKEEEFNAIFGMSEMAAGTTTPSQPSDPAPTQSEQPAPVPSQNGEYQAVRTGLTKSGNTVTPGSPTRAASTRPPLPLKSELLERLRTRSHQAVGNRPPAE